MDSFENTIIPQSISVANNASNFFSSFVFIILPVIEIFFISKNSSKELVLISSVFSSKRSSLKYFIYCITFIFIFIQKNPIKNNISEKIPINFE